VSEFEIVRMHACMLTGSVGMGMISVCYLVCLGWWLLCAFTLRLVILVSIISVSIQLLFSKLLVQL